jgi:subtilase family serine protease
MSGSRLLTAITAGAAAVALTTLSLAGVASAARRPAETVLAGSTVPFTSHAKVTGSVAGRTRLTIQLWLTPDVAAATRFATAVSTPGSADFHHYLSPAGYTARFGPSAASARAVESWLRSAGFTAVHTDAQRNYVRATATVNRIDAALHTTLRTYRSSAASNAGRYALRANDRPVSLPAALAGHVLGVTGLDNAAPRTDLIRSSLKATPGASGAKAPCSNYYGQHQATGLPRQFGVTSFPTIICGYSATQMRGAYRASWTNTGKGETVALIEDGLTPDMFQTLQDYARVNHLPAPSPEHYAELSLGQDTCGDPFDIEEQLDVEVSHDMAPDANQLVVGGDSCNQGDEGNQGLFDADIAVLDGAGGHPLATAASNSWLTGPENQPASWTRIENAYLVRAAAEGVGMYFSAGDGSGLGAPATDPFAISVGGTSLGLGAHGQRLFETGWSDGSSVIKKGRWALQGEDGASGGGASVKYAEPAYQRGVVPVSVGHHRRSVPDLSANADPFTGMALGLLNIKGSKTTYFQIAIGGTSESSPLVAGMVTAAQQGQAHPFGFINPAIYKLAGTSAFFDALPITSHSPAAYHGLECDIAIFDDLCGSPKPVPTLITLDDQNPKMKGYTGQVTLKGYDNMTGLGTPDGPAFIAALRKIER